MDARIRDAALAISLIGVISLPVHAQTAAPQQAESPMARQLPSITSQRSESRSATPATIAAPRANKPVIKGAFETYAETVTGARLDVFGRNLFSDVPTTFSPIDAAQVNEDYVIGPGDELQLRGWGMLDVDVSATVDRSGAIYVPRVGSVKVAGVKYRDLQGYLKKAINRVYSNFELTVSLSQVRAVQVYVVGHAVRPGTYTLSALSTLLNALFTSGGPDATGSMRAIQIKRGGVTVTSLDLYDMIVNGDKSRDVPLQDGDVIYIPEAGPMVALTGNVKTPAIFDLKGHSTAADLVHWAGGFESAAEGKHVVVEKSVDNTYNTIAELTAEKGALADQLANLPLAPADIIRVFAPGAVPVQTLVQKEYVRVAGEVHQSGVFLLRKGETLPELMARIGGVNENGYVYALKLNRESVRRSQQAKLEEVADRFEKDIDSAAAQRVAGTTEKDALATAASQAERQRITAQRLRTVKAEGRIVLELADASATIQRLPSLPLQDGDSIYVPRKPGTVDVLGAVFQPNSFIYRPNRNAADYLALAGGETAAADLSEAYLIRADGTAQSGKSVSWFSGFGGLLVNPGDTVVVPDSVDRSTWRQSLKEWTSILYQFGLGAAGLRVLKN